MKSDDLASYLFSLVSSDTKFCLVIGGIQHYFFKGCMLSLPSDLFRKFDEEPGKLRNGKTCIEAADHDQFELSGAMQVNDGEEFQGWIVFSADSVSVIRTVDDLTSTR